MEQRIKILILEHDPNDLGLLQYDLKKSGLNYAFEVVQTREAYQDALQGFQPDIILSDYSLPTFDGLSAFRIRQELMPDTPFIIVSGTIGEENAVELIKMGVTDYVIKEKMYQVGPKIHRALKEANDRLQKEAAERQLRQREQQLQRIMNLSLDVICTLDRHGRVIEVSAASKAAWGYLPEELLGRNAIELVHAQDREKTLQAIGQLTQGTDLVNFENQVVRKNGTPITMFWSARWDAEEQLSYWVGRDATDIKQAAEKIKNNEKRFRTLLQNSTDGLTLIGADNVVIERSPSALKILGLDVSEVSGALRSDLLHPGDVALVNEACNQVKAHPDEIRTVEFRFLKPDGHYIWVEATFHNQLQEPAVSAIVVNFRDVTQSKLAAIALEKSEEKYRNLFNLSPIPMWLFEVETLQFLDVNEAAIKHYGFSKAEFLSMNLLDIKAAADASALKETASSLRAAQSFYQNIDKHILKSGEVIDVDIKSNVVDLDGRETRLVLAADISERLRNMKAVEEQNTRLREIAWIQSHVVRAPLARLMGLISLLEDCPAEKVTTTDVLGFISASAHELDGIIRDIVRKAEQIKQKPVLQEQVKP